MNQRVLNKAKDFYYNKFKGLNLEDNEFFLIVELMIEFATEMCELQKQACSNIGYNFGNEARDVVQEEILNCKNVCTA
jgi:hypothetical protein